MKKLNYQISNLFTGLKLLSLFAVVSVSFSLIVQSCQREQYENNDITKASEKFKASIQTNKSKVGSIMLGGSVTGRPDPSRESIYVDFPGDIGSETTNLYSQTNSIQGLSNLIDNTNAIIQYSPTKTNSDYEINVSVEAVKNSLAPLIADAKNYLYTKGFTNQEIDDMISLHNGTEEDLIPYVMSLTHLEEGGSFAQNLTIPFVNNVYAKLDANDYLRCAGVAIGADVLWSLGASSAATWGKAAMVKAFGAVAKRLLGPIGVAIAVVSFGVCLHEANYD